LLVNSNCDLKICDFGLARVDEPDNADRTVMSNYVATRWYRAPEVILSRSKRYTKAVDLWSVGCILAELIGRKPIFPGRDSFHQITLILAVLGSPPASFNPSSASSASASSSSSTAAASGAAAAATAPSKSKSLSSGPTDDYILNLPKKARVPFRQLYPRASPLACDLLEKLLCFEPEKRLTVEQALRHPYLSDLHCEDDEPVCTHMDLCDFYFEYLRCSKDDLRVLIHQEIVNHYPEEAFDAVPAQAEGGGGGGPLDQFNAQMLKSLPKHQQAQQLPPQQPRKGRRKSF
jgi:mitogen-activated protein kinase 1/3